MQRAMAHVAHVTRRGKASLFRRNTETGHYLAQMAEGSRSTNLMCPPLRGTLALSRRRPSEAKQPEVAPELPCESVAERVARTKSSFSRRGMLPGLVDVSAHAWKLARQLNLDHHEVKFALDTLQSAAWSEKNGGMDLPTFRRCLLKIFDRQDISDGVLHAAYEDCGVGDGPIEPRRFVSWYRDHLFSLGCEGGSRLTLDLAKKHHCSCMDLDRVKMKFDQFDTDKSGAIEYPEFERMIFSLLHCSKNDLPECRMQRFWHELDQDGNGVVDFQEFTEWYLKYFALAQLGGPIEAFYASFSPDVQRASSLEAVHLAAVEKEANSRPTTPTRMSSVAGRKPSRSCSTGFLRRRATVC